MQSIWNDLRFAVRQLRKSPGFALTAIFTLALGIGANTAMFTVIDAVLLRPLPYPRANRLVVPKLFDAKGQPVNGATIPDIQEWQQRSHSFRSIAYASDIRQFMDALGGGESISNVQSSANLFSVLNVTPQLGRAFGATEQTPGRDRVAVLSDALWNKYFHRDPNVLGKTIKLEGQEYTVIGVMPKGFTYPFSQLGAQVWTPLALTAEVQSRSGWPGYYSILGRLRAGVSQGAAQTELNNLQHSIAKKYPANYGYPKPTSVQLQTYRASLVEQFRPALLVLLAACGMLWLIACANVASLLLVRGTARNREVAVRAALGAGRARLLWQAMTESLLLSLGAAAVGLAVAVLALHVFRRALLQRVDIVRDIHLNLPVLLALATFSICTAVVCGIVPALLASSAPPLQALQHGGLQISVGRRQKHLRDGLMVIEIALSLTLLVACGLLLRTLYAMRHEPLGIRTDHILTADFDVPTYRYRNVNLVTKLYQPLLEKTQHLADVKAASLSTVVPLDAAFWVQLSLYGNGDQAKEAPHAENKRIFAQLSVATPDLQRVFGFRMLEGRFFNVNDTANSQPVVVVNRAFAKEWWPHGSPLGHKFMQLHKATGTREIVIGVMDDLPQRSLANRRGPQVMLCLSQLLPEDNLYQAVATVHMELAARTHENPQVVIPEIRRILGQIDPQLRGAKIETMDQVVEDSMGDQKLAAHLLELFGGTALLITLAGLYGSLLYMVGLRRREMAIRLAVGAQRRDVVMLILSRAAALLIVGLVSGIALSYATGRFLRSYLFGVHTNDWLTLLAACTLFALSGMTAAYIPARRAALTDPVETLREE
ncbi:MAG TPA: ABC transporter permease [Acidobacteriaceae bacterium]|nr:ABC transporter permease [Acidobacteriaceae bacterium]